MSKISTDEMSTNESGDWTNAEIDASVRAYIDMLEKEVSNKSYSKAEVNRTLRETVLLNRTKGSVEFRMQNISSVLKKMNRRWIEGYKPAANVGRNVESLIIKSLERIDAISPADLTPESDNAALDRKVLKARKIPLLTEPDDINEPKRVMRTSDHYERSPLVKAWVLNEAKGICELCDSSAPFVDNNDLPFLEVHHVKPISIGGRDSTSNAVAVCPNCHRRCHHSKDRLEATELLYNKVQRLVRI